MMSEAERPDRLAGGGDHHRGHPRPGRTRRLLTSRSRSGTDPAPDQGPPGDDPVRLEGQRQIERLTDLAFHSGEPRGIGPDRPRRTEDDRAVDVDRRAPGCDAPGGGLADAEAALIVRDKPEAGAAGYLDLLEWRPRVDGRRPGPDDHQLRAGDLRALLAPGAARAVKGITGPGMAEEARIARLLMGLGRGTSCSTSRAGRETSPASSPTPSATTVSRSESTPLEPCSVAASPPSVNRVSATWP